MPRHSALIPLSHDHHHSLVLALRLKKGSPTSHHDIGWPHTLREQVAATLEFVKKEILPHFKTEESILFGDKELTTQCGEMIRALKEDHDQMRRMIASLGLADNLSDDELQQKMQEFGILLERHIRKEEREFFPMLEALEAGKVLEKFGSSIAQMRARHTDGESEA